MEQPSTGSTLRDFLRESGPDRETSGRRTKSTPSKPSKADKGSSQRRTALKRWQPKSGKLIVTKARGHMDRLFSSSFLAAASRSDLRKLSAAALDAVEDQVTSPAVDHDVEVVQESVTGPTDPTTDPDAITQPRLRKRNKSLTVLGNTQNILVTGGVLTRKEGILELKRMVAGEPQATRRPSGSLFSRSRRRMSSAEASTATAPAIVDSGTRRSSAASTASSRSASTGSGEGFKSRASRRASLLMSAMARAGSRTTKCVVVIEKGNFYFNVTDAVIKSTKESGKSARTVNEGANEDWEVVPVALINNIYYQRGGRSFVLSIAAAPEYGFDEQDIEFRCRTVRSAEVWLEHVLTQVRNQAALTESIADLIGSRALDPDIPRERAAQYADEAEVIFKRAIALWKLYYGVHANERVAEAIDRYAAWISVAPLPHGAAEAVEAEVEAQDIRIRAGLPVPPSRKSGSKSTLSALDELRLFTDRLVSAHLAARRGDKPEVAESTPEPATSPVVGNQQGS